MNKTAALFLSALTSVVLILLIVGVSFAQTVDRYWTVKISKPAPVMASSIINLDYIVFSTVAGDTFDVTLLNNGSSTGRVDTIVSTGKGGDSGRFTINNIPDGTYTYSVLAKNTADGTSQVSDSAPFTVNLPDTQTVVISGDNSSTAQNEGVDVTVARTNTTAAGDQVATVATTSEMGNGLTEVSSTEAATNVAAATNSNTRNFSLAGLALLVLIGATLWYGISRYLDNNET